MKKVLTKEQIEALNLDLHIALNANAGSGKTSVLVERYFKILEKGLKEDQSLTPDNIVAITFTKKAAAEMLSRVVSKFSDNFNLEKIKEKSGKLDLSLIERLRLFRNKLTNARISTIHSFCLQIISNYPIESGIPVNFREISESERLQLLENAFNQTLMNWLDDTEKKKHLSDILSIISFNDLKEVTYKAISNIDLWEYLNELYSKSFDEYFDLLQRYVRKTYQNCLNQFCVQISITFQDDDNLQLSSDKVKILKDFLNESQRFKSDSYRELLFDNEFWELLGNFIGTVYTQNFTPRKKEFKDQDIYQQLQDISQRYKGILKFLLEIIEYHSLRVSMPKISGEEFDIERRYYETSKTIFSFIKDVNSLFAKLKYDEGFVDFSDMLVKTRDLFKNFPDILNEVRKEIKFLLVDEFQDTDQIQFEIVKMLVPSFASKETSIPNLFIVGDEKQSIYSFRNADVRVFKKAKEYITELNYDSGYDVGLLKLTTTFRLRPEIAGFVDKVFTNLMDYDIADPVSDFNINYEPFVIPEEKLNLNEAISSSVVPPITFLFEIEGEEANKRKKGLYNLKHSSLANSTNVNEDEIVDVGGVDEVETSTLPILIAKHIRYIVNNEDAKIFDKEKDCYRTVRYSDIALISRKTKDLAQIASVFSDFGIPFLFFGSKNFFSTREVRDIIAFLKFLVNPKDDVSLAGVLRSVFFAFTDELLTNIATVTNEKNVTFWEKLHLFKKYLEERVNSGATDEFREQLTRVNFAIEVMERLLQQVSILPINEIIHRILVETEWHKKVRVFQNAEQMLANIDELLDYARDYINIGFRTILDFLDDIDYISRQGIPDVDRFGFVASDAVTLLTFHSAKGLEFPVVYVHNIDYATRGADNVQISRELGLIFPIEILLDDEVIKFRTLQNLFVSKQLQMEEEAEELRILYVALTRASDYLIITGKLSEQKTKADKNSENVCKPRQKLKDIFDVLEISIPFPKHNYGIQIKSKINVSSYDENKGYKDYSIDIEIPIKFIFDLYPDELIDNAEKQLVEQIQEIPKLQLLDKIESSISKNIFSSTKFNIFATDTGNYVRSYFLGIHRNLVELMKSSFDDDFEDKDDLILPSIVGNTIHFCLERINDWYTSDGFLVDKLYETIDTALYEQKRQIHLDVQRQIVEQCSNVIQTKLFKKYDDLILTAKKEFELIFPFENNYLIAKLDILFQNEDGNFEIWDWKSNNVRNVDEMIVVAESYKLQMETYAFALWNLYPSQDIFKAKLLFTRLAKPNANDEEWTYDFRWTRDDLFTIKNRLIDYISKINNLEF